MNNVLIGFRAGHLCEGLVVYIVNEWIRNIDQGKIILAVFVDFKRAFDTIDIKLLLGKLREIGLVHIISKGYKK